MTLQKIISKLDKIVYSATTNNAKNKFKEFLLDNKYCESDSLDIYLSDLLFIKKTDVQVISKGTSQTTINIGEKLLLKTSLEYPDFDYFVIDKYHYNPKIIETTRNMKKFKFNVPKSYFIGVKENHLTQVKNGIRFLLVQDLRDNGQCNVNEYSDELVKSTSNAKYGFVEECEGAINFLFDLYNLSESVGKLSIKGRDYWYGLKHKSESYPAVKLSYRIIFNRHIKEEKSNPLEAVKHVFFIVTDKNNYGKLYAGDLDHIFLLKNKYFRNRQFTNF